MIPGMQMTTSCWKGSLQPPDRIATLTPCSEPQETRVNHLGDAHQARLSLPAGWLKHRQERGVKEPGEGTEHLSPLDKRKLPPISPTQGPDSHPQPRPSHLHTHI